MFKIFSWWTLFAVLAVILIAVQEWRDPKVDPNYVSTFYRSQTQVWDGNGYLALQGLQAPAEVKDSYAYGQQKILQIFARQQELKRVLKVSIPPLYPMPDIKPDPALLSFPESAQLKLERDSGSIPCRYILPDETDKDCFTADAVQKGIAQNKILWERFNKLPDYKIFSTIPIGLQSFIHGSTFMQLGHWKSTEIVEMAATGNPEGALREWRRFEKLYRAMLGEPDTLVWKAIVMVVENNHRKIYTKLLRHHPVLSCHINEIEKEFPPSGLALYQAEFMWSDDWSQLEEAFLSHYQEQMVKGKVNEPFLMPSGDFRNRLHQCAHKWRDYVKDRSASDFSPEELLNRCRSVFPATSGVFSIIKIPFVMTGNVISNYIHLSIIDGSLMGGKLILNMYKADMEWQFALLGTRIIYEKVPAGDISAYLERAENRKEFPVLFDAVQNRLYFKDMYGTERSFYLPAR